MFNLLLKAVGSHRRFKQDHDWIRFALKKKSHRGYYVGNASKRGKRKTG